MSYWLEGSRLQNLLLLMTDGLKTTLQIFFVTLALSIPLGWPVAFARMSRRRWLSIPASFFILIMRGTPLMLQLFAVYFFLPSVGIVVPRLTATYIAFGLNYAAYFAEIYRGGLSSIPMGQREAARVLGIGRGKTFLHILLPQTFKRVLLPVSNEVITLVKDTSLSTVIAVPEMFIAAKNATSASGSIFPLFVAGLFFLLMNSLVTMGFSRLVRRFDYYQG